MKLKTTYYFICASVAFVLTACDQQKNASGTPMSPSDSAKIAFYDRYFLQGEGIVPNDKNKPVDPEIAKKCVDLYLTTKNQMHQNAIKKMLQTESVSFNMPELQPWMDSTLKGVDFDNMRVCFGVYNVDALMAGGKPDSLAGRLTVYLWPYLGDKKALKPVKDGQRILVEPFNLGTLNP